MSADKPDRFETAGAVADAYGCWNAGEHLAAEDLCREILVTAPGTPAALYLLGVAALNRGETDAGTLLLEQACAAPLATAALQADLAERLRLGGRLAGAEAAGRRAVELDPCVALAWTNLAVILLERGAVAEAERCVVRAVALDPRYGRAYGTAASIANRLGEPDRAAAWIGSGLLAAPNDPALLMAEASALRRAGDLPEARALCNRLIEAGENAWDLVAEIEQDEGRAEPAIAAWDRAIALAPRPAPMLADKANLLLDLGRIDEAAYEFGRALVLAPNHAPALFGQASIARFRRKSPDIAQLEELLASGRIEAGDDRLHLHFALGQAYLDGEDPARAFQHFSAGNGLRRSAYAYDVAEDEQLLASIAATFPAEMIAARADVGDPGESPIFIVGMPRSGTSLLEQILAAHPDIHGAGELLQIKRLVLRDLAAQGPFPSVVPELTADQFRALGRRYVEATAALAPGAKRIVDKLPLNFYFAGLIRLMLPNARIIHIRRDPLDTCLSCYTTLFREPMRYAHDQAELGRFYRAYQALMEHWRRVLPADRFIEVDYGDLVADPETQARRLLEFCGMPWDDACLRPEHSGRPIRTASRLQARQPVHRTSVGRAGPYRDYLGPLVAALAGD
jgi:tetratricopeptide (TPR) repeat protein